MNINLVYEGKDYNFDIPNGVTIDYLKELSSKIFNSEKELLDLVYNNEKFSINDNNTLIRDLIPDGETNAVLTVQINRNLKNKSKNNSKKLIPLVNLKQINIDTTIKEAADENITSENNKNEKKAKNVKKKKTLILHSNKEKEKEKEIKIYENQNMNQNGKENKSINNFKPNININSNNFRSNLKNNKIGLVFNGAAGKIPDNSLKNNLKEKEFNKKLVFESAYIKKNNELLSLIKEFNERIKKIYLILYKNYRNSGLTSNNLSSFSSNNTSRSTINLSINNNCYYELSLFEKKLISFLEKQIQYYKSILEITKKYGNNVTFNQLTEFYNKLIVYNYIDNINIEQLNSIKLTRDPSKNLINSNSSINLSTLNSINNNKLPVINNKNSSSPVVQEKSRNIILGNINGINSMKTNNSINYKQINENINKDNKNKLTSSINNIEIKNSKLKKNNYNEDINILSPNHNINNSITKNIPNSKNASNNNIINNNDNTSEKSSDENNNNALNSNINNNNNKNVNNISPIHLKRRASISNIKLNKITNDKDNGNNINNINDEKLIFRSPLKNMNKLKNSLGKGVIVEDLRKNDNSKLKKDKKIKDINVSSMTINDSNFAREKHFTPKRNKKNSINKYDFLV